MTKWNHFIDIKPCITEDESWEGITLAANGIAKQLKRIPTSLLQDDWNMLEAIDFLAAITVEDSSVYTSEGELLDEVNGALSVVYDFADEHRIWLGL